MSEIDDALARLASYNGSPFDAATNPRGFSGRGGVPANWVQALRDVGTATATMQATYVLVQSAAGGGFSVAGNIYGPATGHAYTIGANPNPTIS